jgi:hypothetical protein
MLLPADCMSAMDKCEAIFTNERKLKAEPTEMSLITLIIEPTRAKDRTEILDPMLPVVNTLIALANRVKLRMETLLPNSAWLMMERSNTEPTRLTPMQLKPLANRTKERTERLLPDCTWSRIERCEENRLKFLNDKLLPSITSVKTLIPWPTRKKLRMETELPNFMASKAETADPNRTIDLTLMLEPPWTKSNTLKLEPNFAKPRTDKELPM